MWINDVDDERVGSYFHICFFKKWKISADSKQIEFRLSGQCMGLVPSFSCGTVMSLKEKHYIPHCISAAITQNYSSSE